MNGEHESKKEVLVSTVNSCIFVFTVQRLMPDSHEIDGVRKEKERLTAASIIDIFQAAHYHEEEDW